MSRLPERPNLEQLKKQAKSLLHAAHAKESDALRRFLALPAFAGKSVAEIATVDLALHDAQSVIAREHGLPSWNALREEIEARALSFDAAVDEFIRSATSGGAGRAQRLLALHPGIASASLYTALVLADAGGVEARLQNAPELATAPGGPQNWDPLLYLCQSCMHGDRTDNLVGIARRLCELGANPNAEYHWNWHPELPRTALWASLATARSLPLAQTLLQAGANPTDGVSAHIASSAGSVETLELLHRSGMDVNGVAGGVPPLVYSMFWTTNPAGPRWLIEHGADTNLAWGPDGEGPLHVAARRWNLEMVDLLVSHGADLFKTRADGRTPHTLAELYGNHEIAQWLLRHGARDELSRVERFIGACTRGDREAAMSLRTELHSEHHLMLQRFAESGDASVLETMLACGFDPHARDKDGVTALHRAAMAGQAEAVRVLLAHGAPVDALDGMFSGTPLLWAVEGRHRPASGSDHVAVARLLIAAGSPVEWTPPEGAPGVESTLEGLGELRRAAAQ